MSKFKGVKTNNAKTNVKEILRQNILNQIRNQSVCEVFCGSGEMYDKVWKRAVNYLGIDREKYFDKRNTWCGDAFKLIKRVNPNEYNIFDIDAYGDPYGILIDIIYRINKGYGKIGFVITDGIDMDLKMGRVCKSVQLLTGINAHVLKRANIIHEQLIDKIIKQVAFVLNGNVTHFKIATGKKGSKMKYFAFIINENER